MHLFDESECAEMLIDLVCHEIRRGHLSREMGKLFDDHLKKCPACRRRALSFVQTITEGEFPRNFG